MFEKATRMRVRFETPQGNILVEDLWEIPLSGKSTQANLDDIAKGLFRQLQECETTSFVVKNKSVDERTKLKFDIVKHVIDVRLVELEASNLARSNKEKKQHLLAIIAAKETEQLMGSSLEELKTMAESL